MKKIIVLTIVFMAIFAIVSTTYAGMSMPSTGSGAMDTAVKTTATKGFEAAINDKIKKYNCQFKDETSTETTCDLVKITEELSNWRNGLEATVANDVDVYVNVGGPYSRATFVRNELHKKVGYWDYVVSADHTNPKGLDIWVKVD